jgi:aminoglycoside 6'-N-acetyltransferase
MYGPPLDIPTHLETERLVLRCYEAGDGQWYYAMCQRNRVHLAGYEPDNVAMTINSEEDAEVAVRDFELGWAVHNYFFMGVFSRVTGEFVAQIYVGPVNRDLPEFQIGYFADVEHEGHGYVMEAVKATLGFIFEHLRAHRVRLECDDTNVRSYRVAERCGMVREGHFRENKRNPDGTISGTLHFGMLRSEFVALKAGG